MTESDKPLIEGPHFPVRVVLNKTKTVAEDQTIGLARIVKVIEKATIFVWLICFIGCIILSIVSLLQKQSDSLHLLVPIVLPWVIIQSILGIALGISRLYKSRVNRDERMIARLDWLRYSTPVERLGLLAAESGTLGWITKDGLYLERGKQIPWRHFIAFRFDSRTVLSRQVSRIQFLQRHNSPPVIKTGILLLILSGFILAGVIIAFRPGVSAFERYGFRDDVLAVLLAAVLSIIQIGSVLWCFQNEVLRPPKQSDCTLAAKFDPNRTPPEDIFSFLQTYLPIEE